MDPALRTRRPEELETELMVLFRDSGSTQAFEALYDSSRGILLSWILHLLAMRGQNGDPAELLQDTYVNVYRYAKSFREGAGEGFRGWARTIAANVVRRATRRRALSLCSLGDEGFEISTGEAGPERETCAREQVAGLAPAYGLLLVAYAHAYARLSPRDRLAMHLVEVEGLDYAAAGQRLRVGASNMKMIMFRARKRLRGHLTQALSGTALAGGASACPAPCRASA